MGGWVSTRRQDLQSFAFAGTGEKLDEFEPFHPERIASRILGMGDVVSLVEKAAESVNEDDARRMAIRRECVSCRHPESLRRATSTRRST